MSGEDLSSDQKDSENFETGDVYVNGEGLELEVEGVDPGNGMLDVKILNDDGTLHSAYRASPDRLSETIAQGGWYQPEDSTLEAYDFNEGEEVAFYKRGKLVTGWKVAPNQNESVYPDMVRLISTSDNREVYMDPEWLIRPEDGSSEVENRRQKTAEELGENALEDVIEPPEPIEPDEAEEPDQAEPEQEPDNGDDGNEPPDNENGEAQDDGESIWLDPRFMARLQEKYLHVLDRQEDIAQRLGDKVTEHYKSILRTQIIETAIKDVVQRAAWLSSNNRNKRR
jgi:hypothetical protein